MFDTRISRRAALMGAGAVAAWLASPARALLQAVGKVDVPAFVDQLDRAHDARGESRAAAASWRRPGAAAPRSALNPPSAGSDFQQQVEEARQGQLTGVFNGNGARMARILQTAAVKRIADEDPADLRRRHHPRPPHHLPGAARRSRELRARACPPHRRGRGVRGRRARASTGPSRRWSTSRATSAGAAASRAAARTCCSARLFAAARVRGFQGADLKSTEHMLACIKHFAAYGAAESGLDYNAVDMSERRLREVYLPPYKAGFDAGALSAMASFNEINGVPSTGNHWLHDRPAARRMGFPGLRRLRLHRRRGDDRRTATPRTAATPPGSPSSPAST